MTNDIYGALYQSPNFGYPRGTRGRNGYRIEGICLHICGGAWEGTFRWVMNPKANASYNAVVQDDGTIVSLVAEANAAYSHGRVNRATWPLLKPRVNPNLYTLSVARTGSDQRKYTAAQLQATVRLLKHWCAKYELQPKRPYIFGHFEVDSVGRWYCPGRTFFNRCLEELAFPLPDAKCVLTKQRYEVIAGSYLSGLNALKQVETMKQLGYRPFIRTHLDAHNVLWQRVVAGGYDDQAEARAFESRLRTDGFPAFVVAVDDHNGPAAKGGV